jgi:hypothetical protein
VGYSWDISKQATERIIRFSQEKRFRAIDFFDELARDFDQEPEDRFISESGTEFLMKSFESTVVTYHVDHPVKLVHIIALD